MRSEIGMRVCNPPDNWCPSNGDLQGYVPGTLPLISIHLHRAHSMGGTSSIFVSPPAHFYLRVSVRTLGQAGFFLCRNVY